MQQFIETVIHGKKLARTIGFPTANLKLQANFIADGTYKINIIYKSKIYSGVGSARNNLELFEAHIFDFDKEIYGEKIEIIVLEKIRENQEFTSLKELKIQIQKDVIQAKKSEIVVMSFGTFDIFHPGHKYFLSEAKKYGDKFFVIIARDTNVEKLKGSLPRNDEISRLNQVKNANIADKVFLGDEKNPMKWIECYKPKVICLGYDQTGFSHFLETYNDLKIVRIESFKPDIYKSSKLKK